MIKLTNILTEVLNTFQVEADILSDRKVYFLDYLKSKFISEGKFIIYFNFIFIFIEIIFILEFIYISV